MARRFRPREPDTIKPDDSGTLGRDKALRRAPVARLLADRCGRIAKLMGDGRLCDFGSLADAATCAARMQQGTAADQAALPQADRIALRIGGNLGHALADDDALSGDDVATRLQLLGEPGGGVTSRTVGDVVCSDRQARHRRDR